MNGRGWDVYLRVDADDADDVGREGPECIDTVFFDRRMSDDEVRRSLVDHDGYDPRITVEAGDVAPCLCCGKACPGYLGYYDGPHRAFAPGSRCWHCGLTVEEILEDPDADA